MRSSKSFWAFDNLRFDIRIAGLLTNGRKLPFESLDLNLAMTELRVQEGDFARHPDAQRKQFRGQQADGRQWIVAKKVNEDKKK